MRGEGAGACAWVVVAGAVLAGCVGASDAEVKPPCPDGWSLSPEGNRCVPNVQTCHAWLDARTEPTELTCVALSDGKGFLRVNFQRGDYGHARVLVTDADGEAAFDRSSSTSLVGDFALEGAEGEWQLTVTFRKTEGHARIQLWG